MEIICVPAIVTTTYVLIELYKKWLAQGREKWLSFIPVLALIIGGILGVAIYYSMPQLIIAENEWWALIVGLCSGLSATGTNQVFKQLSKLGIEVKEVKKIEENKNDK